MEGRVGPIRTSLFFRGRAVSGREKLASLAKHGDTNSFEPVPSIDMALMIEVLVH